MLGKIDLLKTGKTKCGKKESKKNKSGTCAFVLCPKRLLKCTPNGVNHAKKRFQKRFLIIMIRPS